MKNRVVSLAIFAMLIVTCIPITLMLPGSADDLSTLENDVDLDGIFPAFNQADYISEFLEYAEPDSRLVLSDADLSSTTAGHISNSVGIVLREDDGLPIIGATVHIINAETDKIVAVVQTDSSGRFQVIGLPDAYYNWIVNGDSYKSATYYRYDVRAGEITDIFTFYLSKDNNIIKICREGIDWVSMEE